VSKYNIIYADPAWSFKENWGNGCVKHHYKTMSSSRIENLDVKSLTDKNAHLYLWTTNSHIHEALHVMSAWGFNFKQILTWVKTYKNGDPIMGLGYYYRGCTEHLLFGVKGSMKILNKNTKNLIIHERPNNKHSKKPDLVRDIIVACSGNLPRIELFSRKKVEGWDAWGDEVENDIAIDELNK